MLRLAAENPRRIAGQIASLGQRVSPATVWAILKKASFDPAPQRSDATWVQSSKPRCPGSWHCDFFQVETITLARLYCFTYDHLAAERGV